MTDLGDSYFRALKAVNAMKPDDFNGSAIERKSYGVASGMLGTMRLTGQAFSMGIALLLFALYIGRVQITPEYYALFLKSMKTAFSISAILCFAGIFASIARGKTRH